MIRRGCIPSPAHDRGVTLLALVAMVVAIPANAGSAASRIEPDFQDDILRLRSSYADDLEGLRPSGPVWTRLESEFPVPCDWMLQDGGPDFLLDLLGPRAADILRRLASGAIEELGAAAGSLRRELDGISGEGDAAVGAALDLWLRACEERRARRLGVLLEKARRIVFTKHANLGGSHYAYTEGQSDAQDERHFTPGASLCLLEMVGTRGRVRTLFDTTEGSLRDPEVDFDGRRILFSFKESDRGDDYHLRELDPETGEIVAITSGPGFADYEAAYLPGGDIVFNSTRPVQTVDCWWTEVSNLYTCARDGRFLRRLTFDQVHDNFPTVLPDGRVVYTRWEYSDRGQIYPQGLFVMRPDGTAQTALYGNNSWFPTSILHARGIPGTSRLVAILSGHHTLQCGKLAIVDPGRGTEEDSGVHLIAPVREARAERVDVWGQEGELFQYPYPLAEDAFLVAMSPLGRSREPLLFAIYLVASDGRRELLASDPEISSNQPIPLAPRTRPPVLPGEVDYRRTTGELLLQDVHAGPGLAGIPRGSVKTIRVVALEYRAAGISTNFSLGPGGDSQASTPISIGNGSWDVKSVLGEAAVHEDGSAFFTVPARTPVYFQALDERGYVLQTMRSWATLQPGERASCVGCHEAKCATPRSGPVPLALRDGPQTPSAPPGEPRGFSFARDVQPILDRHCVSCHSRRRETAASEPSEPGPPESGPSGAEPRRSPGPPGGRRSRGRAFSLLAATTPEEISGRAWSDAYLALTAPKPLSLYGYPPALTADPDGGLVRWVGAQSAPPMLEPGSTGAIRSPLLEMLSNGHRRVRLSREELKTIACWIDLAVPYCGDYTEANVWSDADREKYRRFLEKRRRMEEVERRNIADLIEARGAPP